jgi:hypothetical protein
MLQEQHYPSHWITSVLDRGGRVVARSVEIDRFIGVSASPRVLEHIRSQAESAFETETLDGKPILAVTSSAKRSGWTVVIGIPLVELKADMRHKVWSLVFATVCLLGSGLLFAWKMGTTIHRAMHGLIEPALALGANLPVRAVSFGVREADAVGEALVKASEMPATAQHQATHDALTGLANRMMFHAFLEPHCRPAWAGAVVRAVFGPGS